MDFNDLKNTVSNLTLYDIKAGFRKAQNAVMNYTEMEAKVREATNNEPWGASSTLMQEIANGTFSYQTLNEIMPMIYRRFTEKSPEEWRQIYKSLQLLEFLIKHGSERVIDDARGHITLLKMLRQFHYIDQNDKDQGINVRNRAKELAELLGDVDRIRSERKKARATKNKYMGVEGGTAFGGGFSGSNRFGGFGNESSGYGGGSASYGGYSGGVYGDGGGFGGQTGDFRDGSGRSDRFEEYDEFDEDERPTRPARNTEPATTKKISRETTKKKEPEVDLFSFDEAEKSSTTAPAASNGPGPSGLAQPGGGSTAPAAATDEDDEFDDFQSAVPAPQPAAARSLPLTATASTTAQFAAPQSLSAPQKADLSQMISASSIPPAASSPTAPVANYTAFAVSTPSAQAQTSTGYQPSGQNYFGTVQSQSKPMTVPARSMPAMMGLSSPTSGPTTMANTKPVANSTAKPSGTTAGGGDAFGALWGKASAGINKSSTPAAGPAMGQLAKEKSRAGIWGPPAAAPSQPTVGSATASGSASGDFLGEEDMNTYL